MNYSEHKFLSAMRGYAIDALYGLSFIICNVRAGLVFLYKTHRPTVSQSVLIGLQYLGHEEIR